jgi:hypothetical protein
MRSASTKALARDLADDPRGHFPSAAHAKAALSHDGRARLASLEQALRDSWLLPAPQLQLASALQDANPAGSAIAYPRIVGPDEPTWVAQTLTGELVDRPIINQALLPTLRVYADHLESDPFADRPASLGMLLDEFPTRTPSFFDQIVEPNGVKRQLRVVLKTGHFVGWLSKRTMGLEQMALFNAAQPALREWSQLANVLGVVPVGDGSFVGLLELMNRPAVVLRGTTIVHANQPGKSYCAAVREWLARGRPANFALTRPVQPRGVGLEIVLPLRPATKAAKPLPPALRRIADELVKGASDKDIAQRFDMPLSTARTYVTRVLRYLGVNSRRELMIVRGRAHD